MQYFRKAIHKEAYIAMSDPTHAGMQASTVIRNIGQLVTVAQQSLPGASGPLQVISNAALAVHGGKIVWLGPDNDAEPLFQHEIGRAHV